MCLICQDAPALQYIKDQFRQYEVTSEKYCRGQREMFHIGETYLTLLQSQRKWDVSKVNNYNNNKKKKKHYNVNKNTKYYYDDDRSEM